LKLAELMIGQNVVSIDVPDDVGQVEAIGADGMVYVRFGIPGRPGCSDVIDIDPADLRSR
jgi:hypothetical protein